MQLREPIRGLLPHVVLLSLGMACSASAWCATFTVNPVRIQVSATRPNAMLQVTNREDQPVTLQFHVVTWSFEAQKDIYVESDDFTLNPPIAVVGPHKTQSIRLGLRHAHDGTQERSYRLIIEEVPMASKPEFQGVQTLLRVSIPIFAMPKAVTAPKLNWQAVRTNDARLKVIATNHGSAHIQIKALNVTGADSADSYLKGAQPTYLLPNQQREWLIDDQRSQGKSRIKVLGVTDAGAIDEIIEIQHP